MRSPPLPYEPHFDDLRLLSRVTRYPSDASRLDPVLVGLLHRYTVPPFSESPSARRHAFLLCSKPLAPCCASDQPPLPQAPCQPLPGTHSCAQPCLPYCLFDTFTFAVPSICILFCLVCIYSSYVPTDPGVTNGKRTLPFGSPR